VVNPAVEGESPLEKDDHLVPIVKAVMDGKAIHLRGEEPMTVDLDHVSIGDEDRTNLNARRSREQLHVRRSKSHVQVHDAADAILVLPARTNRVRLYADENERNESPLKVVHSHWLNLLDLNSQQ
jgi:hypothetical protein